MDRTPTALPVIAELAEAIRVKAHRGPRTITVPFNNVAEASSPRHHVSVREDDGTLSLTVYTADRARLIVATATFSHMPAAVVADVVEAYL